MPPLIRSDSRAGRHDSGHPNTAAQNTPRACIPPPLPKITLKGIAQVPDGITRVPNGIIRAPTGIIQGVREKKKSVYKWYISYTEYLLDQVI